MTVIEVGNIAERHSDRQLPECGIVIEATKEELMRMQNLLYASVEIKEAAV